MKAKGLENVNANSSVQSFGERVWKKFNEKQAQKSKFKNDRILNNKEQFGLNSNAVSTVTKAANNSTFLQS